MSGQETVDRASFKLPLFKTDDIPRTHRQTLIDALRERRSAIGRTFSCAAVLMLVSVMGVLYGAASALAWIPPANPVLGSILAVFSAGFLASSVYLTLICRELASGLKAVPERLRRLAEAEAELESEILLENRGVVLWNSLCDELLNEDGCSYVPPALKRLREDTLSRLKRISDRISRFNIADE